MSIKFSDELKFALIGFMSTRPFLNDTNSDEFKNSQATLLVYETFIKENKLENVFTGWIIFCSLNIFIDGFFFSKRCESPS